VNLQSLLWASRVVCLAHLSDSRRLDHAPLRFEIGQYFVGILDLIDARGAGYHDSGQPSPNRGHEISVDQLDIDPHEDLGANLSHVGNGSKNMFSGLVFSSVVNGVL
jgi:hypothetical protein